MTKPVTEAAIVGGKFVACFCLVILSLFPTLVYYFALYSLGSPEGNIDTPGVTGSYLGLILLGGSGAGDLPFLLKAFPAKNWPPLGRTKWNRRLLTALGATGTSFGLDVGLAMNGTQYRDPFPLTVFAALGFVLELLVVEEQLFACREHEVRITIDALQHLVLEFHARGTPFPVPAIGRRSRRGMNSVNDAWQGIFGPPPQSAA